LKHFLDGKRTCSEAVAMAGGDVLGVADPHLPDLAIGLAGGVGLQGRTCGALLGAGMVTGLAIGRKEQDYAKKKKAALAAVGKLYQEFKEKHGSTDCRTLCGLDLTTLAGRLKLEAVVKRTVCVRFVETAARLMAQSMAES
jgi:C_GCAxxG_C_C family probable redox protein